MTDTGAAYVNSTTRARLTVTKSPITLRLQDASGAELMRATAPLAWNASGMTQTHAQPKLTAKHSGLSLAVDGTGKVLQVTDTGAATQRWTATANEPAPGRPRFEVMRAWKRARDDLEPGLVMQR
ncbi:hypothetical protein [Terrabacter sp. Ter38]|uniref:hypothetical protein n=1 Tax=Terrabacter sp. Ter38 TaxID=2926030 RepID=UPI0021192F08|nr:hypothetical protein [Terrabacter sp. Ter38]